MTYPCISHALALCLAVLSSAALGQVVPHRDITPAAPSTFDQKVKRIVLHPMDGRRLLATFARELRVSYDGGATWKVPSIQPTLVADVDRLWAHKGRPGVVFLEEAAQQWLPILGPPFRNGGRTFRSADFGETWTMVRGPYAETDEFPVAPFGSDPDEPETLFATRRYPVGCRGTCPSTDYTVIKSHDGGITWSPANAGLPSGGTFDGADGPVPGAPSRLYYVEHGGAHVSTDSARTWTLLPSTTAHFMEWVKQDPTRPDTLYALGNLPRADQNDTTGHSRILRSDDAGRSWRVIFTLDTVQRHYSVVPTVTIDPVYPDRIWMSGAEPGVFLSQDGGATWTNLGFPSIPYGNGFPGQDPATIATNLVTSTTAPSLAYLVYHGRLWEIEVPALRRDPVAIEYQAGNRYWVSADQGESLSQDYRGNEALRTGTRFGLWSAATAPPGAQGFCRFQGNPARGQTSRFLTLEGAECDVLRGDEGWTLEGEQEFFAVPTEPGGRCAVGLVAVTRFVNGLRNANHRYVVDPRVADEMRTRGWIREGVAFCARPLGSNE